MWRYGGGAEQHSARIKREQSEVAKLVIVESPAKARTIGGYLGKDYVVESSIGHIRDLPNNAADTPAKIKDKPWGRLAVDVDNGFVPYYVVPRDKKSHIAKLKKLVKEADALYLATDEDREGEAIAWHLLDELKPPKGLPVHRMVFHEITKPAILAAVENPREINDDLVEAQEARRILDRLYGYEVSPVLWKKVMSGLSAGRVQSVATRLVVDKERERMKFRVASYWDIDATFDAGTGHDPRMFPAKLYSVDDVRVARGSDFDNTGELKSGSAGKAQRAHLSRADAERPVSNVPSRSQYEAARNAIRSRSRSTTRRVATDWTRPADSFGLTFFHSTGETS
jgi:DNA topoisomerase-1